MSTTVTVTLPDPSRYDDGIPYWEADGLGCISAWPQGLDLDGTLDEDVDLIERGALALLAAVRAHRGLTATAGPAATSGHPCIGAERAAELAGGAR